MNWMFWKKPRCPICDERFEGSGSEIHLMHAEGVSRLRICNTCSAQLQAGKEKMLGHDLGLNTHGPAEEI